MILNIKKNARLVKRITLDQASKIIGRSSSADIQLIDPQISRHHVRVKNNGMTVTFEDMGSRNGMFFKGERVQIKELYPGQTLFVGEYVIGVSNLDVTEQNTMAIITDGDDKTDVALSEEDIDMMDNSETRPPHDADHPSTTVREPKSDSFMKAIAVTDPPPSFEDDAEQDLPSPTIEQENQPQAIDPSFNTIEKAPPATLASEIDNALDSASYVGQPPESVTQPSYNLKDMSKQTKKIDNPMEEKKAEEEKVEEIDAEVQQEPKEPASDEKSSAAFVFSSLQSKPDIEDPDSIRDVFNAPSDDEKNIETGAFASPPSSHASLSASKTEIRDFKKPASLEQPQAPSKPKSFKTILFVVAAVGLAVLMLLLDKDVQRNIFGDSTPTQQKNTPKLSKKEQNRIVTFKIEKINQALEAKDLETAREEMKTLLTEHAEHPDVVAFRPVFQTQATAIDQEIQAKQQALAEKQENITKLFSQADKFIEEKKFDAAIETYQKVLELDPQNTNASAQIENVEALKIQEERKAFAQRRKKAELDRIFREAVEMYQAGDFGGAKRLFQKVAEDRSHSQSRKARSYLNEISQQTDGKLTQQINDAREQMQNLVTLPDAYASLSKILKQFPSNPQAKSLFAQAKQRMDQRARELYADAVAQEELVGDFSTALDLYHEVLLYAPEPQSEYHKKARAKIQKLEL